MTHFHHYMYVLECGDGSLYTGYTTDVAARVAAHQAGTGAKYTKSHEPVELRAQARFYSKERAMSAEAHFKQLDRKQKDALLAKAAQSPETPFEDVLRQELAGFGEDTAQEFVCRNLAQNVDLKFRDFSMKLIPTVDPKNIAGVRTPVLRKIAKDLAKREDVTTFLNALPHRLFDENQVHAFAIGQEKDYQKALKLYEKFLPHIDNRATCDQLPTAVLAKWPEETLNHVKRWFASTRCYTIRFGIGVLMHHYLDDRFEPRFLELVASTHMPSQPQAPASEDDIYYVNMMRAWYFAEALAKQEQATLPYLKQQDSEALLDEWTRRKAIQKAIESRRISPELKDCLRKLRKQN